MGAKRIGWSLLLAAAAYFYIRYASKARPQIDVGEQALVFFTLAGAAIGELFGRWKGAIVGGLVGFPLFYAVLLLHAYWSHP